MKKSFFMMILCCTLMACSKPTAAQESTMENGIEVLYFHTNQRCATCIAIEENAKSVVENLFAAQCANGDVVFRSVNIADNEALADKYQVTWSSLVVVDHNNGTESSINLTAFAFANARKAPETFQAGLAEQINNLLND